jgi:hypothetical protein
MLPATTHRVEEQTPDHVNERIRRATDDRVARYAARGPGAIRQRLTELDHEWDMERALEANAAAVSLLGVGLGAFVDRRWFILPAVVSAFLLQHALQGWCPPVSLFRRLGVRTSSEIDHERYALKALRGDFEETTMPQATDGTIVSKTLEAVRR